MITTINYADVFRPNAKKAAIVYDGVLIITGSLLIGLCAQIAIYLPISAVPITAQTFAVLIIAALFGPRLGTLCVIAYIIEGAAGLPVFAAGRAGPAVLAGPTGGYLVGFVAAAYTVGLLAKAGWDRRTLSTIAAMVIGNAVIYAFAILWLTCLFGASRAVFAMGIYPFIVGDILKIALAAILLPTGWKILEMLKTPGK